MDPVVKTWTPLQEVASSDLNNIQANAVGLRIASLNNDDAATVIGAQWFDWQDSGSIALGTLVAIDDIVDWRDSKVLVHWRASTTTQNTRPGGANDYLYSDGGSGITQGTITGYLGVGALDAGGVNAPSAGNPPVPAATTSYAVELFTSVWLYAHPTTGDLYLYNDTAGALYDTSLLVMRIGPLDKR